jgi:MYXO-CTERM domain-containing protein
MPTAPSKLALVALLCALPAQAADQFLKYDNFTGTGSVSVSVTFPEYAGAGVLFAPDAGFPLQLKAIDVFAAPASNGTSGDLGAYILDVWDESAGGAVFPPTTIVGNRWNSNMQGGVQLTASLTQFNRFTFPSPITITSGRFFVAVREQLSTADDGTTIAMDTGPTVPGANYWFNGAGVWSAITGLPDAGTVQSTDRNWILRAVLTTPDDGGTGGSGGGSGGSGGSIGTGGSGGAGNTGLSLTSIDPTTIMSGDESLLTLLGSGFDANVQVIIGTKLISSGAVLLATVAPRTLNPGVYDVTVINNDGSDAVLTQALTVTEGVTAGKGCSCATAGGVELAAVGLLLLLTRRRRRSR